jgi:hypothetical protein
MYLQLITIRFQKLKTIFSNIQIIRIPQLFAEIVTPVHP